MLYNLHLDPMPKTRKLIYHIGLDTIGQTLRNQGFYPKYHLHHYIVWR